MQAWKLRASKQERTSPGSARAKQKRHPGAAGRSQPCAPRAHPGSTGGRPRRRGAQRSRTAAGGWGASRSPSPQGRPPVSAPPLPLPERQEDPGSAGPAGPAALPGHRVRRRQHRPAQHRPRLSPVTSGAALRSAASSGARRRSGARAVVGRGRGVAPTGGRREAVRRLVMAGGGMPGTPRSFLRGSPRASRACGNPSCPGQAAENRDSRTRDRPQPGLSSASRAVSLVTCVGCCGIALHRVCGWVQLGQANHQVVFLSSEVFPGFENTVIPTPIVR